VLRLARLRRIRGYGNKFSFLLYLFRKMVVRQHVSKIPHACDARNMHGLGGGERSKAKPSQAREPIHGRRTVIEDTIRRRHRNLRFRQRVTYVRARRAQLIDEPWQTVSCDMMLPSADPFVTRVCVASSRKKLALRGTDLLCSPSRPFVIADRLALSSAHRSFGSVEPKQE
jgi:hypothetical protein